MTKNTNEFDGKKLTDEAVRIQENSTLLLDEAKFTYNLIIEFTNTYTEDHIDVLPWDERETAYKRCDQLIARLQILDKELKKLDRDYNDICKKVNSYYGKELMPRVKLDVINFDFLNDEE